MAKDRLEARYGPSRRRFGFAQQLLRMSGIGVAMMVLIACERQEPVVIDGSSPQSFAETTKAARRQIPNVDRLVFDQALRSIGGRRHANRDPEALARLTFDGMTAEQVVADQKARE